MVRGLFPKGEVQMSKYIFTYDKPLSFQTLASNSAEANERFTRFNEKLLELVYSEGLSTIDKGTHVRVEEKS